jgi:hypothetical protein
MLAAFLAVNGQIVRADQPNDQTSSGTAKQTNTTPPVTNAVPPAPRPTLRDKLFHWSAFFHAQSPCQSCNLTDPDFCCNNCKSEWIFVFGSCREFYGDRSSNQAITGFVPYR